MAAELGWQPWTMGKLTPHEYKAGLAYIEMRRDQERKLSGA